MKILLAAINAKYIHMNPAVYSIRAFVTKGETAAFAECIEIAEYTINQYAKDVLTDIYEKHPDVIGFSCYIWNMNFIREILVDIKKVLPDILVFLGGPEVSYNKEELLLEHPSIDGIFFGEGEQAWKEVAAQLIEHGQIREVPKGLFMRNYLNSAQAALMNLDDIPFIYDDLSLFDNRMLYYETSRGCPYRCSYCLSSIDKTLRFRSLDKVYKELQFFLDNKVKIVKFIDRTFNAKHDHAFGIWKYLKEHDNGITRFHFEIEADIISDEEIEFLKTVREGLFQFEIGVQSVNQDTLNEINRFAKIEKIKYVVQELGAAGNIPLHVDLIAGLPYEDLDSFIHSFNEVYTWKADELQLGFLKVLHGTVMEEKADEYGLLYERNPPYEILGNKWITYKELVHLKEVENQLERYSNSKAFCHTLKAFERLFGTPFEMFEYIAAYYKENLSKFQKQSRASGYEMIRNIIRQMLQETDQPGLNIRNFDACLLLDLYEREKLKTRPEFFGDKEEQREKEKQFLKEMNKMEQHLPGTSQHVEFFDFDVKCFEESGEILPADCKIVFCYEGQGAASCIEYFNRHWR